MRSLRPESRAPRLLVGLMSGTSADGIDAVVVRVSGSGSALRVKLLAHCHRDFSVALRRRILQTCLHGSVGEICELNFLLGERFAAAALAVLRQSGLPPARIRAIGSHGQTIHHLPNAKIPSTLQIGEPAVIAERTGITTDADFRVRDMAAGGQGAPLVPYADWVLFADRTHPRIIQNLGGIGNLTFLPANASLGDVIAFDTGPGNMVIDAVVSALSGGRKAFDRNGRWAAQGSVSAPLLTELMTHPFLCRRPPKSTGREEFGEAFVSDFLAKSRKRRLAAADTVATATAFTAASIADAYRRFVFPNLSRPQSARLQIILGGGGAKNPTLRRRLAERLEVGEILTHADLGIPDLAKEALAFALLADATLRGQPSNVLGSTGARRAVVLGKITPGNSED